MRHLRIFTVLFVVVCAFNSSFGKVRIAVFPFNNQTGIIEQNIWCYDLQDTIYKALVVADPANQYYDLVPIDSVEMLLAEMNLDPNNPQYMTDMWKVAKLLNVSKVISGTFNIRAERYLMNTFIYDVRTKMPHPKFKSVDHFKKEADVFEAIPIMINDLLPAFM